MEQVITINGENVGQAQITGSFTSIDAPITQIFDVAAVSGTWNVSVAYPEWFGAVSYMRQELEASTVGTYPPVVVDSSGLVSSVKIIGGYVGYPDNYAHPYGFVTNHPNNDLIVFCDNLPNTDNCQT